MNSNNNNDADNDYKLLNNNLTISSWGEAFTLFSEWCNLYRNL